MYNKPLTEWVSRREVFLFNGAPFHETQVLKDWRQMNLKPEIVTCLTERLEGHGAPNKFQQVAVPLLLHCQHSREAVILQAPTGHGKTAAFTIPILQVRLL